MLRENLIQKKGTKGRNENKSKQADYTKTKRTASRQHLWSHLGILVQSFTKYMAEFLKVCNYLDTLKKCCVLDKYIIRYEI